MEFQYFINVIVSTNNLYTHFVRLSHELIVICVNTYLLYLKLLIAPERNTAKFEMSVYNFITNYKKSCFEN